MLNAIKSLFGTGVSVDFKELMNRKAVIIDVRSKGEYEEGHIGGSINIPLGALEHNLNKIKKNVPVITCCASGMRSASAKGILSANGYEVYNGGSWFKLRMAIQ